MKENESFTPYIPAERITPELTVPSVIMGMLLAVVFGAANAYLGLRVGLTVSASIPAAVISMGTMRVLLRRKSLLESNAVQTIGSAGEALAAGAIFTLPALYLWAAQGVVDKPSLWEITLIALPGGLLGVAFMVPLRNALIVKEHGVLPYPEGTACAEVLLAGEEQGRQASTVFSGMGVAALFKFVVDGLKLIPGEVSLQGTAKTYPAAIGTQIYPAVMSVGYICGPRVTSYIFAGGVMSWLVLIPLIVIFGSGLTLYPGTVPIGELFAAGGAASVWSAYIRYIGAGALAAGGIFSLLKTLPLIVRTFRDTVEGFSAGSGDSLRTERNIPVKWVALSVVGVLLFLWLVPTVPLSLLGAAAVVTAGFFFAAVSSRMVGLVGSSNNPVSGMAIATLLLAALLLKLGGQTGGSGMRAAIVVGSVICIVVAIAGDGSQDLKTGYLLGATPMKQQIGELVGAGAAAVAIGFTLNLLDSAWQFGSSELAAPQATLMKLVVEGIMGGNLPWGLILVGVCLAVVAELLGIPVLPFAIGAYLPIQLSACIMVGGLVRLWFDRRKSAQKEEAVTRGVLFCSGMIAGEGLMGILLAVVAVLGAEPFLDMSRRLNLPLWAAAAGSLAAFGLLIVCLWRAAAGKTTRGEGGGEENGQP